MTVLVTGATGNVGGAVLAGLRRLGVGVRALSRDPARLPAGVDAVAGDLTDPAGLGPALAGVRRVFLYPRTPDAAALFGALARAGVEHVVLLSAASAADPTEANGGSGLRQLEAALAAAGPAWTALRPGTFAANATAWAGQIRRTGTVALPYPESVQAPVHERDIADVAVAALTGDRLHGAAPVLTGPAPVTLAGQVAAIGAAIGRELTVVRQSEREAREFQRRFLPPAVADAVVDAWRASVGVDPPVSPEVERITGRPGRPFAQWARDHADRFR